ncbi:acyltransferase [Hymenobacter tibetensis]|uniref:Acyltransferase n=1 Tax=Hymenobacter tibetensis TaxID=497967 RepID=A0ABY4CZ70_9BACT|nr:acyltransferase [Hymenobacter tibetensis]UOG74829.1 acyltransferase [Hymenobacter tibetensis]
MTETPARLINANSSLFLDAIRLGAALLVAIFHAHSMWFPSEDNAATPLHNLAHAAVVVFFALSGYVIAYTTTVNNRGLHQYMQARFSRLYSVVIPALIITGIAEIVVSSAAPELHDMYSRGASLPRYLLSGSFLNEIWFMSAAPPMNTPLWSLGYEFWYYMIFGLWFFRSAGWKSTALLIAACVIAGPKILLMMPIWLAGFAAYRLPKLRISTSMSWLILGVLIVATSFSVVYFPILPYTIGAPPLYFTNQFLTDWVNGFLFSIALWFLPLSTYSVPAKSWVSWFRKLADLTFPIYILHTPLLILSRYISDYQKYNITQMWQCVAVVLITSALIGVVLEKQRPMWTKLFKNLFSLTSHFQWSNQPVKISKNEAP